MKAFFVFYRFLLPAVLTSLSWKAILWRFVVADLVSSYWLAIVFQANHVVEEVQWPLPNEKNEVEIDWGELQVVTAQDYAHKSLFWTNCAGALNFQVVHHLFPNVSALFMMFVLTG
jgi:fatty acid desaturase